ncbi:MAG: glycosyltransferase [Planctomycetes bacterium]|nr:glycosyltransferase [Planctomycetota bacterium]
MRLDEIISLFLAAVLGGVWIYQSIILGRVVSERQRLGADTYDGPPTPAPRLSVLVAAKDEESNIEACIDSLLDQDYPEFEIIAIDDRSEDATPDILARLERRPASPGAPGSPDRLRVVTVSSLPDGWQGKSHAMHKGVALCTGEWLLFTDADCRFTARNALSMAMRDAIETDTEFLSMTPFLETLTTWERIVQPACALVLMLFFVPKKVNDPKRKTAYANGAFMLLQRSCYDIIGGHKSVQGQVNEDIQLAKVAKRMAVRLRVVETDDLYRTRMYSTMRAAWAGWSRILYGSLQSMERLLVAASAVCFFSIGPWLGLILATVAWAWAPGDGGASPAPAIAWLGVVVVEQFFMWRVYRLLSVHPIWSITHVVGAFFGLGIIINAMRQLLGTAPMTWRGTTYRQNDEARGVTAERPRDATIAKSPRTKQANA